MSAATIYPRYSPGETIRVKHYRRPEVRGLIVTANGADSYGVRIEGADGTGRIVEVHAANIRPSGPVFADRLAVLSIPANHATRKAVQ